MLNKIKGYKSRHPKHQYTDFPTHFQILQIINYQTIAQHKQNCHFLPINFD